MEAGFCGQTVRGGMYVFTHAHSISIAHLLIGTQVDVSVGIWRVW